MTQSTDERIRLVMAELRRRREQGLIAPGQEVSPGEMATISQEISQPVSKATFLRVISTALAKQRAVLTRLASTDPDT